MGFFKLFGFGIILFLFQTLWGAESDTTWLFGAKMTVASTPTTIVQETDTGAAYDGSYINFDYHFSLADSALYRPGYAGFRMVWDYGNTWILPEDVIGCDSIVFAYKGLLPTHKATVFIASSGGCALPVILWKIGTIQPSANWKKASFTLPSKTIVDSIARAGLCEIRFIINDTVAATVTSGSGNFKVDNIALVKPHSGVKRNALVPAIAVKRGYFISGTGGVVNFSMYSPKGEVLLTKDISVSSGKVYSVSQFIQTNSSLRASQIRFVRIRGARVDFTGKEN
jgi:hypothetical protein